MLTRVAFYVLLTAVSVANTQDLTSINIGGIFDFNSTKELAFQVAVNRINKQSTLEWHYLTALPMHIGQNNPAESAQAACDLFRIGIVGLLGPFTEDNAMAVQSACDNKEVPLLETRWDYDEQRTASSLNIYPYAPVLARAYADLVRVWDWKSFTVFYEANDGLFRLHELLKLYNNTERTVSVRQLDKNNAGNYRPTFKEALRAGETNFVLDCSIENLDQILRQAQQVGLMTNKHNYIVTNLDMHTIDLAPYKYGDTNITGLRLLDPEDDYVIEVAKDLRQLELANGMGFEEDERPPSWSLKVDTALTIDAVVMFAQILREIELDDMFDMESLYCEDDNNWQSGLTIINLMKTTTLKGLTGIINFDFYGYRSDFTLDIVELKETGITNVGKWSDKDGLNISRVSEQHSIANDGSLVNTTFIVITALTPPYAKLKDSTTQLTGNDRYEGFGVDLIDELSKIEGFNYTFIIRADASNGKKTNGKWSGMIGDVIDHVADLAIVDLTITIEREEAVDFTSPFMTFGISMLFQKPSKAPPSFFSFADPFGKDVWLLLATAYFAVSMSLFIMGRLCFSEWTNPYPCIDEPEFLVNQFSLRNAFWFTIGSLMQQGSEIAPIALATRMVAGLWWFFTLIMVSSYTANLAAFLTTESPEIVFSNIKELLEKAETSGVSFGAKAGGATADFFKGSDIAEYKLVHEYMVNHPENMVKENTDGVKRAEKEKYAFFMESSSVEYETQRHCNLTEVGDRLADKGYGIAMRKNSTYRHKLSSAVLKLQESGKIDDLKRKWWQERGGICSGEPPSQEAQALLLMNVSGVFWVTCGGVFLASFLVFIEMLLHVVKRSLKNRQSVLEELKHEFQFYFSFDESCKPVKNKSPTGSPAGSQKSQNDPETNEEREEFKPDVTKSQSPKESNKSNGTNKRSMSSSRLLDANTKKSQTIDR